jgi:hypothetical protein
VSRSFDPSKKKALEVQEKVRFDAKLDAHEQRSGIRDLFRGESPTGRPPDFHDRRERSLETSRQRLRELLAKKNAFPASEAFGRVLEQPLVFPDDARKLVAEARKAGWLTLELGPRERTPKPDTRVTSLISR